MSCTQKQQLVCFPKVRVYKPWFRHFNDHKDFRNEGTVHLFSLMALFSYANFRSNERVINGDRYMEAPGQWICKLGALPRILRVHSKAQALELMEYFQDHGFLTFEILDEEKEILRFTISDWKEHCTHLQYNYYSYKGSGFFFFPLPVGRLLLKIARKEVGIVFSELDAIMDMWLHTILNDPKVRGSEYVEIIGNNQMITTAYIDRAHTFNNKKTAEKYCSLLPKAMKNLKYKVIFISNPNPENPDLQLELLTPEFYLTRLKNFSDFIHTIQCQRETLVTGQRKAELEIEDIEHAAEFYNLDALHGYQLYKLLHDARVRRRKCKNAIAWIDYILEQAPDRFIENDPSPRIAGTRSRDYAPRALPALFEWENEGQTPTANLCP